MSITQDAVLNALRQVKEPEIFKDIITLNMVRELKIDGSVVRLMVEMPVPNSQIRDDLRHQIVERLKQIGVSDVQLDFRVRSQTHSSASQASRSGPLPQVKHVIAIGAGKGGVGKSTVAVNLAVGLQRTGARVGLMDGDIYGPSIPTMLGIKGAVPQKVGDHKIKPFEVHGIHAVTIGSLMESDKPLIWRGPMAHGAFKQLLLDHTHWPELDYLIVDLPPGTGDVPLTLCQLLSLSGAVVVATPQQVALDDAIRAIRMFQQLNTPVLGVVENMSYFIAPDGSEHDIFGRGGTRQFAESLGLPLLAEIPMFTELRTHSDGGRPHANFESNPKLRLVLENLAKNVQHQIGLRQDQTGPTLDIT